MLFRSISQEKNVPTRWTPSDGIAWRLKLPGRAGATPVVWNDSIFLTSVADDNNTLLLMCVGTDGKVRWTRELGKGNKDARVNEGNSAPSPVTDGKYVWTFLGNGPLACHDFDGKEIWKFDVQERYGKLNIQFGMTSSQIGRAHV